MRPREWTRACGCSFRSVLLSVLCAVLAIAAAAALRSWLAFRQASPLTFRSVLSFERPLVDPNRSVTSGGFGDSLFKTTNCTSYH